MFWACNCCRRCCPAILVLVSLFLISVPPCAADWTLSEATLLGHSFSFQDNMSPFRWQLGCQGQRRVELALAFSAEGDKPGTALRRCTGRLLVHCIGNRCMSPSELLLTVVSMPHDHNTGLPTALTPAL
mgnify:CR=1 FL=1